MTYRAITARIVVGMAFAWMVAWVSETDGLGQPATVIFVFLYTLLAIAYGFAAGLWSARS